MKNQHFPGTGGGPGVPWGDFTIRELSGNYPGFGVGWLAGLAGLGCAVLDVPFDHLVKNSFI